MKVDNGNLVLTRRLQESIKITLDESIDPMTPVGNILGEIMITPVEFHGKQIRLKINANKNLSVIRTELIES